MKLNSKIVPFLFVLAASGLSVRGVDIVNDTWSDGTRTDPGTAPVLPQTTTYSENGVDQDLDGSIESTWFGSTLVTTTGTLSMVNNAGSTSYTNYFTAPSTPITLGIGNSLKLDWTFTTVGSAAQNAGRNLRAFLGFSNTGARLTADGTPVGTGYLGYTFFQNMGVTVGTTSPLEILERTTNSATLLNTASDNTQLAVGGAGVVAAAGFTDGTPYTFEINITRSDATTLLFTSSFSGGTINGTGSISLNATDATASTFSFDTFALRPSNASTSATSFNTTNFRVQFVPEPSTFAALGAGLALFGCVFWRRRRG